MTNNLQQKLHTKMLKTSKKCTYNIITHWNLLYALKIWSCLNFIQKRQPFFAKSSWYLLRSDRCLINVNVSLEALLEGQGWW